MIHFGSTTWKDTQYDFVCNREERLGHTVIVGRSDDELARAFSAFVRHDLAQNEQFVVVDTKGIFTRRFLSGTPLAEEKRITVFVPRSCSDVRASTFSASLSDGKSAIIEINRSEMSPANVISVAQMCLHEIWDKIKTKGPTCTDRVHVFVFGIDMSTGEILKILLENGPTYALDTVVTFNYLSQLPIYIRQTVLDFCRNFIVFQCGISDSDVFQKKLAPHAMAVHLRSLGFREFCTSFGLQNSNLPVRKGFVVEHPSPITNSLAEKFLRNKHASTSQKELEEFELREILKN